VLSATETHTRNCDYYRRQEEKLVAIYQVYRLPMGLLLPRVLVWPTPIPKVADETLMEHLGKEFVRKVLAVLAYKRIFPHVLFAVETHHVSLGNDVNRRAAPRSVFLVTKATLRECNDLIRPLQNGDSPTVELQLHGKVGAHTFNRSGGWSPCKETLHTVEESSHGWPDKDIGGGNEKSDVAYTRIVRQALEKLVDRMVSLQRNLR
jgi:hypothetical protein